jgi:hypothetical protein
VAQRRIAEPIQKRTAIGRHIGALRDDQGRRNVLAHHPLVNVASPVKRYLRGLDDADSLATDFADSDHAVALHGHLHARMWRTIATKNGRIEVLGATSASLDHDDHARMAGMNLYDFDDRGRLVDAHALVINGAALERHELPVLG